MTNPDTSSTDTQMNGQSLDIAEQRRKELAHLFPGIFTETLDDQGELKITIDLERLKAELGEFTDIFDNRRERYGMDWPGKRDCLRLIQQPSTATLKPCREESVDFYTTENLFIEGDNLEVLKLLQKSYYGKVKMIYIDPPYNTGKEFIYPDNFSESLDTYLQYAGLKDSEGRTFSTNTANEGRFHTKWLNMMYPRLYLARNLLREDGVVFISIDDNEVENLRRMCDEIFGEENQIACLVWEKGRKNDARRFSVGHEYILVYVRSLSYLDEYSSPWKEPKEGIEPIVECYNRLKERHGDDYESISSGLVTFYSKLGSEHPSKKYSRSRFVDQRGIWRDNNITWPGGGGPKYKLLHPVTNMPCKIPEDGWRFIEPTMKQKIKDGYVEFRKDHTQPPFLKSYLYLDPDCADNSESGGKQQVMGSVFYRHSQPANDVIKEIFGEKVFENPKDHSILSRLVSYVMGDSDIALDFFAGSASFAHAVIESNQRDRGHRKFILVQLPEQVSEESIAGRNGYRTIADLGKERIRRAVAKMRNEAIGKLNFDNTDPQDLGFKVLKLNQSNFKLWQGPAKDVSDEELLQQMELNVDHIAPNASQEDLLYELLIKAGVMPTEKVEQIELAGHKLFSVAEGALLVHLEDDIDQGLIDAVLSKAPGQFICLDKAFHGNDQLKTNAVKTFEAFNQGKEKIDQIDFKTV